MGTYISPEMIQNRQITNAARNGVSDLNSYNSLSSSITPNIWNANQGSSISLPFNNAANELMRSINQPMPNTQAPIFNTFPVDPTTSMYNGSANELMRSINQPMPSAQVSTFNSFPADPTTSMYNASANELMNSINQPMPNAQVSTAFSPSANPMFDAMAGLNQTSQSLMNGLNSPMPNSLQSNSGMPQVDPVTGQQVNPSSNLAQKYNNVALLVNDPRQQAKFVMLSDQIKDGLKDGWFDERDLIKQIIGQLKPEELAALEFVYGKKNGNVTQLREDLRKHFAFLSPGRTAPEEVKMLNQAALASPSNAVLAIKDAVNGNLGNIDKETLKQIVSNADPVFLSQVAMEYRQTTGKSLATELRDKLWWAGGDNDNLVSKVTNSLVEDKTRSGYY